MEKPDGLGPSGSRFWDEITSDALNLVLRPDEYRLLDQACRQLDLIDTLAERFTEDPNYVVKGSTGQPVINPLIAMTDKAIARFQSLVRALQIPDIDIERARQRAEASSGAASELGRLSWKARKMNLG